MGERPRPNHPSLPPAWLGSRPLSHNLHHTTHTGTANIQTTNTTHTRTHTQTHRQPTNTTQHTQHTTRSWALPSLLVVCIQVYSKWAHLQVQLGLAQPVQTNTHTANPQKQHNTPHATHNLHHQHNTQTRNKNITQHTRMRKPNWLRFFTRYFPVASQIVYISVPVPV